MSRRRPLLPALLAALALGTAALAGGQEPMTASQPTRTYTNPVIPEDFPDPFILTVGKTFYAYATNNARNQNVPYQTSSDLVHWTPGGDAMPQLPRWADVGLTWAPEVAHIGQNYLLYYTARDKLSGRQCVGVASARSPGGPFVDKNERPLVCQAEDGGSIDASPFLDTDGKRYLLFKNDGNCCNLPTHIYLQPLSADGLKVTGQPTSLIVNDQLWEGHVIEAPTLHKQGGVYYLLYSSGPYDSDLYSVGYATAKKITGPYTKFAGNPVVVTRGQVAGPGHQALVEDGAGQWWLAYHGWTVGAVGYPQGQRSMRIDPIAFKDGKVVFGGVTTGPRPAPRPLGK